MNFLGLKLIATKAIAFGSTLMLSFAVVSSMPRFKERRQRYFAAAALNGSVSRMQLLHLAGANVNSTAASRTPLCLAAGEGRLTAVRYLLNEGADINGPQPDGNTALTEATFFGHEPVIKELLMRGANVNAVSVSGTALDIAISKNSAAVIELLKHYGAKRADEIR
jgi:ankyrin repeat protein